MVGVPLNVQAAEENLPPYSKTVTICYVLHKAKQQTDPFHLMCSVQPSGLANVRDSVQKEGILFSSAQHHLKLFYGRFPPHILQFTIH
jgi:hypothetical protein